MSAAVEMRRGRFWLYAPLLVLVLIAGGWSAFWFYARGRIEAGFDRWLAAEAAAGKEWSCEGRRIAGFPFRMEIGCSGLTLRRPADASAPQISAGAVLAIAQIYDPSLVIVQPAGPLVFSWPDGRGASLAWRQASVSLKFSGLAAERGALVAEEPVLRLGKDAAAPGEARAARLEAHLRRNPLRWESDRAVDFALTLDRLALPELDQLFGNAEPANLSLDSVLTQGLAFAGGVTPATLEGWRAASGLYEIRKIGFAKGPALFEGQGQFALDELHRPMGRFEGAQSGIDTLGGVRIGQMLDAGALFAGRPASKSADGKTLKPLPPLDLRQGRVSLGPLRLPGLALPPLY